MSLFKVLSGVCEDRADAVLLLVESKNLRGLGLRYRPGIIVLSTYIPGIDRMHSFCT